MSSTVSHSEVDALQSFEGLSYSVSVSHDGRFYIETCCFENTRAFNRTQNDVRMQEATMNYSVAMERYLDKSTYMVMQPLYGVRINSRTWESSSGG